MNQGKNLQGTGPSDAEIEVYVARLRELTRDREAFHLISTENANYGFRRNMLGLRSLGIVLGAAAFFIALGAALIAVHDHHSSRAILLGVTSAADLCVIALWVWSVSRDWVKRQAYNYARALLGSAEVLVENMTRRDR
jgi:hypothetical protein